MAQESQTLDDYFAALARLKAGRSTIVPRGSKITNDAVSLEAGRGKGTIKKSRAVFADLIRAIDEAAAEQARPKDEQKTKLAKSKGEAERCRRDLESALAREVSLLKELYEVKKQLARLTGEKVIPIRGLTAHHREKPNA